MHWLTLPSTLAATCFRSGHPVFLAGILLAHTDQRRSGESAHRAHAEGRRCGVLLRGRRVGEPPCCHHSATTAVTIDLSKRSNLAFSSVYGIRKTAESTRLDTFASYEQTLAEQPTDCNLLPYFCLNAANATSWSGAETSSETSLTTDWASRRK